MAPILELFKCKERTKDGGHLYDRIYVIFVTVTEFCLDFLYVTIACNLDRFSDMQESVWFILYLYQSYNEYCYSTQYRTVHGKMKYNNSP